jgi:predicted Zn-dependent protease
VSGAGASPQHLVERALELSAADHCIVLADVATEANLRWASNTLTTNGVTRTHQLTVISVSGGAAGVVSRQGVSLDSVEEVVRAAEETARTSPKAEDAMPLVTAAAPCGDWGSGPADTSIEVFGGFAPALGEAFEIAAGRGELLFGFALHEMRTTYLGTSTGVRARYDQPTGHAEINAKSGDYSRSVWAGVPTADFRDVDVPAMTATLYQRLGWAERSIDLPAGRYETILPPGAVADVMIYLYWSAGGRDAADGRTVFSRPGGGTRVGDRLTEVAVSLRSDPAAPFLQCHPFVIARQSGAAQSVFDNGLALGPTAWIEDGVLRSLVQTRFSAERTGLPATPYIDNLILDGPAEAAPDLDRMIAGTDRGLLLTCLWYIREVDPQTLLLTGLTRDGVYLVEGGEVVGAVNNFRFNESPVDLLGRIAEVGRTERTLPREWSDDFTRTAMPALRVADFNMSSVSQAL